jgi:hypothetical protein
MSPHIVLSYGMCNTIKKNWFVMVIDQKIDVRTWESEGAMGRNNESVVPMVWNYSMELGQLQDCTSKFLSPKPYNIWNGNGCV